MIYITRSSCSRIEYVSETCAVYNIVLAVAELASYAGDMYVDSPVKHIRSVFPQLVYYVFTRIYLSWVLSKKGKHLKLFL